MRIKITYTSTSEPWNIRVDSCRIGDAGVNLEAFGHTYVIDKLHLPQPTHVVQQGFHFLIRDKGDKLLAQYICVIDDTDSKADRAYVM